MSNLRVTPPPPPGEINDSVYDTEKWSPESSICYFIIPLSRLLFIWIIYSLTLLVYFRRCIFFSANCPLALLNRTKRKCLGTVIQTGRRGWERVGEGGRGWERVGDQVCLHLGRPAGSAMTGTCLTAPCLVSPHTPPLPVHPPPSPLHQSFSLTLMFAVQSLAVSHLTWC